VVSLDTTIDLGSIANVMREPGTNAASSLYIVNSEGSRGEEVLGIALNNIIKYKINVTFL
jgi:hypothetical protein